MKYPLILLSCSLILSCSLYKVNEQIEEPVFTPPTFSQSGTVQPPDRWWQAFDDPQLNSLVDRALSSNLDLKAAAARLEQFQALEMRRNTMPMVTGDANALRGRSFVGDHAVTGNNFGLTAGVSWEVDLWKKLASRDRAEFLATRAAREDLEAVALALSASVARTWFGILAQREQLDLLNEQVEINRKLLEVIEVRFGHARATAVDVFQQREQLASIYSQIPQARSQLELLEHQLAVLLGSSPTETVAGSGSLMPELPELPRAGLPADLIRKRPDLRAAGYRVAAADHRLAAAIAARYPTLRLSGETGYGAGELSDLFSNWIWNLFAGLTAPILDGKALKSEEARNRALVKESIIFYEQAVLRSLQEVEDALSSERNRKDLLERLQEQLDLAQAALDSGRTRYMEGVGDFLVVLTEIQAVQRIQRLLITSRLAVLDDRISLYQALGGDWTAQVNLQQPQTGGSTP